MGETENEGAPAPEERVLALLAAIQDVARNEKLPAAQARRSIANMAAEAAAVIGGGAA